MSDSPVLTAAADWLRERGAEVTFHPDQPGTLLCLMAGSLTEIQATAEGLMVRGLCAWIPETGEELLLAGRDTAARLRSSGQISEADLGFLGAELAAHFANLETALADVRRIARADLSVLADELTAELPSGMAFVLDTSRLWICAPVALTTEVFDPSALAWTIALVRRYQHRITDRNDAETRVVLSQLRAAGA